MAQLAEHPTVQRFYERATAPAAAPSTRTSTRTLEANWLRQLCLEQGAEDVGFVELNRSELANQRADILVLFPPLRRC